MRRKKVAFEESKATVKYSDFGQFSTDYLTVS